jgi:hypothetical protein
MVDEDGVALGLGDALDAEILLHLLEIDIGITGEIVSDDVVRLGHDLVSGLHVVLA